jgi:hypothetical protein
MDEILRKYFDSGPPEMTSKQLDDLCASMAISFVKAYEPVLMISREESAYGYPRLPEDKNKK